MGKSQLCPLCFSVEQFPPLFYSLPKSRISCEIERSGFDLVTYRQLTSVLHMRNAASPSTCKQLRLLYGLDPMFLLHFL